jgi:hypothetical protein
MKISITDTVTSMLFERCHHLHQPTSHAMHEVTTLYLVRLFLAGDVSFLRLMHCPTSEVGYVALAWLQHAGCGLDE